MRRLKNSREVLVAALLLVSNFLSNVEISIAQDKTNPNDSFFDKGFVNQGIFPGLSSSGANSSKAAPTKGSINGATFDVQKYQEPGAPSPAAPPPTAAPTAKQPSVDAQPAIVPQLDGEAREDAQDAYRNAASVIQRLRTMQGNGSLPPPNEPGFVRGRENPVEIQKQQEKAGSFDHRSLEDLRNSIREEQSSSASVDSLPTPSRIEKTVFDKADAGGGSASLSLIVAGKPEADLLRYIRAATAAKKTHNVKLDAIIIVGEIEEGTFQIDVSGQKRKSPSRSPGNKSLSIGDFDNTYALQREGIQLSPISRALYDAGMLQSAFETVDDDAIRLGIDKVPTWVVRSGGEEHVFPGNYEPSSLFNGRGEFVGQRVGEARYAEPKQSFLTTVIPHEAMGAKPLPRRPGAKVYALVIRPSTPQQMSTTAPPGSGPDIVEVPKLASCTVSRIRRQPVHQLPPFFPDNLVFFIPRDGRAPMPDAAAQQKLTLVPYRDGTYDRARWSDKEELQIWAGVVGVHCLPTRFLFTVDKGQPYMEWREGDRAWDAPA